jgi:broad specificity phosphatase PhoE
LSEEGIRDARAAAPHIARLKLDLVVTSKLRRSVHTARVLVGDRVPLIKNQLCNERNFGVMEGLTWDEIQDLKPPVMLIKVGNDLHTVNPKGGEPFEAVWERALKFHQWLLRRHAGLRILVISHGVFLQMFHGVLRGLNCIESLAHYPANLELATFQFCAENMVNDRVAILDGAPADRW